MSLRIQHESFWEISPEFILASRFRFGERGPVTKFVYFPPDELLVLGSGREVPSHKALISAVSHKSGLDTTHWVRGIVFQARGIIYYRQGVLDTNWYEATTVMLRAHGLPATYSVLWGPEAKRSLADDLEGFP